MKVTGVFKRILWAILLVVTYDQINRGVLNNYSELVNLSSWAVENWSPKLLMKPLPLYFPTKEVLTAKIDEIEDATKKLNLYQRYLDELTAIHKLDNTNEDILLMIQELLNKTNKLIDDSLDTKEIRKIHYAQRILVTHEIALTFIYLLINLIASILNGFYLMATMLSLETYPIYCQIFQWILYIDIFVVGIITLLINLDYVMIEPNPDKRDYHYYLEFWCSIAYLIFCMKLCSQWLSKASLIPIDDNESSKSIVYSENHLGLKGKHNIIEYRLNTSIESFHHGCLYGLGKTTKECIKNLNQLDIPDPTTGYTGIHLACRMNHLKIVQQIIDSQKDIDFNCKTFNDENTPLMLAILAGNKSIVKKLIKSSESTSSVLTVRNSEGLYPLSLAFLQGEFEIFDFIWEESMTSHSHRDELYTKLMKEINCFVTRFQILQRQLKSNGSRGILNSKRKTMEKDVQVYKRGIEDHMKSFFDYGINNCEKRNELQDSAPHFLNHDIKSLLECPVCFDEMKPPDKSIYACLNDHWICSDCFFHEKTVNCPTCRQFFENKESYKRAFNVEKIAKLVFY